LFQAADKAVATNDGDVIVVTVLLCIIFVNSTKDTSKKKWQSSCHCESDSTWHDDHQILIGSVWAAADQSENGKGRGGGLLSCQ
jgi:hypothetical protein